MTTPRTTPARVVGASLLAGTCVAGLALLLAVGIPGGASAADPSAGAQGEQGVTVTGTGTVSGTPDVLRADLAVQVTKPTVGEALEAANRAAAAVQRSLTSSGVAAGDVQTTGLSVQPDYDYSGDAARLRGYQATESVTARLRDLAKAGAALTAAATAGGDATRINGVSLDLEGSGSLLPAARERAVADARAKAEQYARAAGRTLGSVVAITEVTSTPTPTPSRDTVAAPAAGSPVPIAAGTAQVEVTVTVVWSFA